MDSGQQDQVTGTTDELDPTLTAPPTLRWAVRAIRGESVGLAMLAVYLIYANLAQHPISLPAALVILAFTVAAAFGLWRVAKALEARQGGPRGVAVVAQVFVAVPGYYMLDTEMWWLGGILIGYGLVTAALLIAPATTRSLGLLRGE